MEQTPGDRMVQDHENVDVTPSEVFNFIIVCLVTVYISMRSVAELVMT
jgi:hypothetical protein